MSEQNAVIVDDEPANRDFLTRLIQQAGYHTESAATGQQALEKAAALPTHPQLLLVDSELPDMKGEVLVKQLRESYPDAKIIMATMHDDRTIINHAFDNGCNSYLVKPHGFMELFKLLQCLAEDPTCLDQKIFDKYGVREFRR